MQVLGEGKASSVKLNLYAIAYRAIARNGQPKLDIWQEELAIGSILPTLGSQRHYLLSLNTKPVRDGEASVMELFAIQADEMPPHS
jgi:hypothetical protein